ncbi:unnamed protein product [Urochloa humidicola]
MEQPVLFNSRDILAESLNVVGGSELQFVNLSEDGNSFQMKVSFSIPHPQNGGVMVNVSAVGTLAVGEEAAQDSACVSAMRVLHEEHGYTVLDYNLLRLWACKERFLAFLEKLADCKTSLSNCLPESAVAFRRIESVVQLFGAKIDRLASNGRDVHMRSVLHACATYLENTYNHAMVGHTARTERFEEMNDGGDFNSVLLAAGFNVLDDQPAHVKLDGALEIILRTVAANLGYDLPEFGMRTQGVRFKCYIGFTTSGAGVGQTFTAFGRPATDASTARRLAVYNSLLAFSVNYGVVISDVYRDAYLFGKEIFEGVASDLVVLEDIGSEICSSLESVVENVNAMIGFYSAALNSHPVGRMMVPRLELLCSQLVDCLNNVGPSVVAIRKEAFVGKLPY